ncbi:hypothetical protein AK812_SmicGene9583 [Symbiodinium microadriaticum]|uniref:Uncharacterized protein n=1 Tax=Symbiodinium microadriaticum TaxID=2951 RepID=A0A1Q9EI72_SYMMI|nr:hypothetical protein AK812_SmicGene9583 [Symbiodinium microadriaticum]
MELGRAAQITVAIGIPLIYLWFLGIPPGSPASTFGKVMAWECALENSIATLIGPVFVAKLAMMFGYTFGEEEAEGKSLSAATALGQAMAATICIPWLVTFALYSLLHKSYPADMRRLKAQLQAEEAEAEKEGMLQERDIQRYKKVAFLDERRGVEAVRELGFRVKKQADPFLDEASFVRAVGMFEVTQLEKVFNKYDVKRLVRMVEDMFPVLARDRRLRPDLQRIMKEALSGCTRAEGVGMQDFLKLMQFFREFQDGQRLHKEQQAVQASGWEHTEVAQPAARLRDLFIAASNASHESSLPAELSFEQFRTMIHDLYPLGDALTAELKYIFAKDADFPEFLLMMRYLWDTDWPSSPGTSRIGIKAKFQDKTETEKPVKAPVKVVAGFECPGALEDVGDMCGASSSFSSPDVTAHALHKKGVDEDFKSASHRSLKAGLDEYAGLLESAKTAEKSAEDAATEFAVENPKDFAQFKESVAASEVPVQNAAEQSANLLEKANTQVLKEDQLAQQPACEPDSSTVILSGVTFAANPGEPTPCEVAMLGRKREDQKDGPGGKKRKKWQEESDDEEESEAKNVTVEEMEEWKAKMEEEELDQAVVDSWQT